MFGWKLFRRRLRVFQMPEGALNDLADRVHQRLRGVRETDNPLLTALEIAAEEAQLDADMARFRLVAKTLEQVYALPPRQRAVLWDHIDGLTYKQIAKRRGMTERIVLRDLVKAFATLRMRMKDDERSDSESGRLQGTSGAGDAGVWPAPDSMGVVDGVHLAGAPGGRVSVSGAVQRSDAGSGEGGRVEPATTA